MTNAWHDISVGKKAPQIVNCIIEIPKDSHIKYELDKETGMLMLDRYLFASMHYPGDYGFIPQTYCEDNDPLDILIFSGRPTVPLTLCEAKVLGVLRMVDGGEQDDKILAVHKGDPRFSHWKTFKDVPVHLLDEVTHFMERYKELENKPPVKVMEFLDEKAAYKVVEAAQKLYDSKIRKK